MKKLTVVCEKKVEEIEVQSFEFFEISDYEVLLCWVAEDGSERVTSFEDVLFADLDNKVVYA